MDVHNGFLHSDLMEEVYMHLTHRFQTTFPDQICRLKKYLYGLLHAPQCLFSKFTTTLRKCGFSQSYVDYSLFTF